MILRFLFVFASFIAVALPAAAVDFTVQLKTVAGQQFKDDKGQPTDMALGTVAENALLYPCGSPGALPCDPGETGEAKAKSFWLAIKLHEKGSEKFRDVDLSAEEIAKIKDKIGRYYPPAIVGAAWSVLDPASVPK